MLTVCACAQDHRCLETQALYDGGRNLLGCSGSARHHRRARKVAADAGQGKVGWPASPLATTRDHGDCMHGQQSRNIPSAEQST